jgi:hypothetical protein
LEKAPVAERVAGGSAALVDVAGKTLFRNFPTGFAVVSPYGACGQAVMAKPGNKKTAQRPKRKRMAVGVEERRRHGKRCREVTRGRGNVELSLATFVVMAGASA